MKRLAVPAALLLLTACVSPPRGIIVEDVDAFVAKDDRMQVFNRDAEKLTLIGTSMFSSTKLPPFGRTKTVEERRYFFKNPRVEGLLDISARQRKNGWEITEMEVDYSYFTLEPRESHKELAE